MMLFMLLLACFFVSLVSSNASSISPQHTHTVCSTPFFSCKQKFFNTRNAAESCPIPRVWLPESPGAKSPAQRCPSCITSTQAAGRELGEALQGDKAGGTCRQRQDSYRMGLKQCREPRAEPAMRQVQNASGRSPGDWLRCWWQSWRGWVWLHHVALLGASSQLCPAPGSMYQRLPSVGGQLIKKNKTLRVI